MHNKRLQMKISQRKKHMDRVQESSMLCVPCLFTNECDPERQLEFGAYIPS